MISRELSTTFPEMPDNLSQTMKPLLIKLSFFLLLNLFYGFAHAAFNKDSIGDIEKCARLEAGFVNSYSSYINGNKFNPGGSVHYSYCLKPNSYFGLGVGGGVHLFKDEGFIPFYFDGICMLSKRRNASFIDLKAGYAFGWSNKYLDYQNSEFTGGIFLGAGIGKKIKLNGSFSSYISLSYRNQFSSLCYQDDTEAEQFDRFNYHMIVLNLGIILEQK